MKELTIDMYDFMHGSTKEDVLEKIRELVRTIEVMNSEIEELKEIIK